MINKKRDDMIKQVKILLDRTTANGFTEVEAIMSSKRVAKLMAEYNINTTELEYSTQLFSKIEYVTKSKVAGPLHALATAIAFFTDTKVWTSRYPTISYNFYGSENDIQIAEFMCSMLEGAVENELKAYKKSASYKADSKFISGRTLTTSFKHGMTTRLAERLREFKNTSNQESVTETGIVPFNRMAIIEKKFAELEIKLTLTKTKRTIRSSSAYSSGIVAGNKVNLNGGKQVRSGQMLLN